MAADRSEKQEPAEIEVSGKCLLCGFEGNKAAMARHLGKCGPKLDGQGGIGPVIRLRFEAAGDPRYWIYVDARASATFGDVDDLLRSLWLECCGHMSAFTVGGMKPGMASKVGRILTAKGLKFRYEYDFGSTTALQAQVVGICEGSMGRNAVRLLARNNPPPWLCVECSAPATEVCTDCMNGYADDLFCEAHASTHPCGEDYLLPVVNSPRMGVCGYTGINDD